MELSGPLGALAAAATRLLVGAGVAAVTLSLGWQLLKVVFSGGSDRAMTRFVDSAVIAGVALAALSNLTQTVGVVGAIGAALWGAVVDTVRSSVGSGPGGG